MNPPWSDYPDNPGQARQWLVRLLPLVGSMLVARIPGLNERQLSRLVLVLGESDTEEAREAVNAVLARTYDRDPTVELARLRSSAAAALRAPIDGTFAMALATQTSTWLAWAVEHGALIRAARCESEDESESCALDAAVLESVQAARDALDLVVEDTAPIEALEAAIAHAAHAEPSTPGCVPDDDDLAVASLVRALVTLSPTPPTLELVGRPCIDVIGLSGRITERAGASPSWWIGAGQATSSLTTGLPAWDRAPVRRYEWRRSIGGGGPGAMIDFTYGSATVARVHDRWRAVSVRIESMGSGFVRSRD